MSTPQTFYAPADIGPSPASIAAEAYRGLPEDATQEERDKAMLDYKNSLIGKPKVSEADDLAKYRSFLADNFINPDTIGTARLYTDPVTGQRKMDVPSIRQEEQP